MRQYNIRVQSHGNYTSIPGPTDLVAFDSQHFSMTDASGMVKTFGGRRTVNLPVGVYSWSVQVQDLPVFPDGTTGTNALATPWSEFSGPARFSVLSQGQQIAVGQPAANQTTGIATIEWGPVAGVASYDVWVAYLGQPNAANSVAPPKWKFETQDGVTSGSYRLPTDAPAGNYRIWLRPNMASAGQTIRGAWSIPVNFTSQGAAVPTAQSYSTR